MRALMTLSCLTEFDPPCRLALIILPLALLACGIIFQSTTIVQENESNTTILTIAIDKSLLIDQSTAQQWQQQVTTMTSYLEQRGATVQPYDIDQYSGLQASISFPDLATASEQFSGDELSLFNSFTIQRWRGEFVFEARTTSALIRQRIQQITGLGEGDLLLVQFPLNLGLQLPGELLTSNALQMGADGTQTWAINWLYDEEHYLHANSRVPLIPPVILEPVAGTRIKDASEGVDFTGTGEPGADIRLYRIEGDMRTSLAVGQIGADRRWAMSNVQLGEPGEYILQVEETTDHDKALSEQPAIEYRPLEPIVFVPGYFACSEGLAQTNIEWHWGLYPGDDPKWETTGLVPTITLFFYGPLLEYFVAQGYELNKNLFVACYDWATSLPGEAAKLQSVMDWAVVYNPAHLPVTIITHSNGGLVARYYIQNNWTRASNQISDLIMIAPPNHGVTRAYYAWEGGDISHEGFGVRQLLRLALARRCGTSLLLLRAEEVHDCLRYGKIEKPLVFDLATAKDSEIISVAWLLPGGEFLQWPEGETKSYPGAPINRLNTSDQIEMLFKGIQRNLYILAGDTGDSTLAIIPVNSAQSEDNPLWQNGKPDSGREPIMRQGDDSVLIDSVFLPEAAGGFPGRYHPYPSYSNANHVEPQFCPTLTPLCFGNSIVNRYSVLADISKIIRESLPVEKEPQAARSDFLIVWVESPVNLMVSDSAGQRIGVDQDGNLIGEISGAAYGNTSDPLGPKFIIIPDPINGDYLFQITGLANGEYGLYGLSSASDQLLIAERGQISAGEQVTFTEVYTVKPSEPSALVRQRRVFLLIAGGLLVIVAIVIGVAVQRRRRANAENDDWQSLYPPAEDDPDKKKWWQRRRKDDDIDNWPG